MKFWRLRLFGDLGKISLLSTFSKDFSPDTVKLISVEFHMQPPSKRVKKVCIFHQGLMT